MSSLQIVESHFCPLQGFILFWALAQHGRFLLTVFFYHCSVSGRDTFSPPVLRPCSSHAAINHFAPLAWNRSWSSKGLRGCVLLVLGSVISFIPLWHVCFKLAFFLFCASSRKALALIPLSLRLFSWALWFCRFLHLCNCVCSAWMIHK